VRTLRSILLHLAAAALGVATLAAFADDRLPRTPLAVAFALFFILVLPKHPRLVAALCGGVALVAAFVFVTFMAPGWDNCADEVDGQLIQYRCSQGPSQR
jgi:hypothetical protein